MSAFGLNDEGHVHDRVNVRDSYEITVIAGADADDSIGILVYGGGVSISMQVNPEEARRLGSLLHEAAADTLSRTPQTERGR